MRQDMCNRLRLGQFMTPAWACELLLEKYYPDLGSAHFVVEPTCGDGAMLGSIPRHVRAIGVEIDPVLAQSARLATGRHVINGDFRHVDLPARPTHFIGNPPFKVALVKQLLERCHQHLPEEGQAGFILPCFVLQTATTAYGFSEKWHVQQDLLPRNLFDRLSHPLCFVRFIKGPMRGLVGFALYEEVAQVARLERRYREILASGVRSTWEAVVRAAFEVLGGTATVQQMYQEVAGHRPTNNQFWQAKVRQVIQRIATRCGDATWRLDTA